MGIKGLRMQKGLDIGELTKNRNCDFCGKPLECDMILKDYGIVKLDGSGDTIIEFDACEECLAALKTKIKSMFSKEEG